MLLIDNTYLDHAGTTLYAESQIDSSATLLKQNLFCNPHTCKITGDFVDQVRYRYNIVILIILNKPFT